MAAATREEDEGGIVRITPIRNVADHARAMKRIEQIFDARADTPEADELEVLTTLVSQFERGRIPAPSPVAAIRFRMQQAGLTDRDLIPYLGSRSRVSEILSGERGLTVDMIRALNAHLGIPAEALLGPKTAPTLKRAPEPSARALSELVATGLMAAQERFGDFVERALGGRVGAKALAPAHLRKTRTDRTNAKTDTAALQGWCAAALLKSRTLNVSVPARRPRLDAEFAREIAKISAKKDALRKIGKFLGDRGIALVLLRHLTGTYLDGAAMRRDDGVFVIALTLRHDRVDNFWFTLLHEYAHVACHLDENTSIIFDDLEIGSSDAVEEEADRFAQCALIPDAVWKDANADFDLADVARLAKRAGVHPAIVAGRWQREYRDYRRFSKLVGHGEVREVLL
jgi:HTH-type transcriptional regulator/antitoxin HigA